MMPFGDLGELALLLLLLVSVAYPGEKKKQKGKARGYVFVVIEKLWSRLCFSRSFVGGWLRELFV